jgi:aspartoacylase
MKIRSVLVVGGTHGNERTGIALVEQWAGDPSFLARPSLATDLLLANPAAAELNRRYLDRDLNRCFSAGDLADPTLDGYENRRARELSRRCRPEGRPRYDLIVDLHTSTANMGVTLITDTDPVNLKLAHAARRRMPRARIYAFGPETHIHTSLRVLARHAVGVEVGPIAQGVLRHDALERTREAVAALLDGADEANRTGFPDAGAGVEVFLHRRTVPFPQNGRGGMAAVVHRELEGRDFQALHPGDPVFMGMDGTAVPYDGVEALYPVFVNEAAYYAVGSAFSLTERVRIPLA